MSSTRFSLVAKAIDAWNAGYERLAPVLALILRPSIYLWPWYCGAAIYAAFVNGDQGAALAVRYQEEVPNTWLLAAGIGATWFTIPHMRGP